MEKKTYIAPALVAVEFCTERGYAESSILGDPLPGMLELLMYQEASGETETFSQRTGWVEEEENNSFWL